MITFVPGEIASAADVNGNFEELSTQVTTALTGIVKPVITEPLVGSVPAAPKAMTIAAGSVVIQTDSTGKATIVFGTAFTTVATMIVSTGDLKAAPVVGRGTWISGAGADIYAYALTGNPVASAFVRVNYVVLGWV